MYIRCCWRCLKAALQRSSRSSRRPEISGTEFDLSDATVYPRPDGRMQNLSDRSTRECGMAPFPYRFGVLPVTESASIAVFPAFPGFLTSRSPACSPLRHPPGAARLRSWYRNKGKPEWKALRFWRYWCFERPCQASFPPPNGSRDGQARGYETAGSRIGVRPVRQDRMTPQCIIQT